MSKKIFSLFVIITTFFLFIPKIQAGSLNVSSSSTTITPGSTVTITVKANSLAGKFSVTSSNGKVLSGGNSAIWIENQTETFKFKAESIGSATVTVTPVDVGDLSTNGKYTGSKSIKINVVKPREKSTNNNLKNLSVEGHTLSPSFKSDVLEYTVELDSDIEKIKVNAEKADSYAKITGTGEHQVNEGDNKISITVTSETGSSKTYVLNAIVKDNKPIEKTVDENNFTVIKRESSLTKPEGFESKTVIIDEIEIPGFYNDKTDITLIGLKNSEGKSFLYIYDSKKDTFKIYQSLTSKILTVIAKEPKDIIDGYKKTSVTINDTKYDAYQYKNNKDYILIYGTNLETGTDNWYLYHTKEETLQIYNDEIINLATKDFDKTVKEYKIVILVTSGLSILLLITVLILLNSKRKLKNSLKK